MCSVSKKGCLTNVTVPSMLDGIRVLHTAHVTPYNSEKHLRWYGCFSPSLSRLNEKGDDGSIRSLQYRHRKHSTWYLLSSAATNDPPDCRHVAHMTRPPPIAGFDDEVGRGTTTAVAAEATGA
jgi:hypothetical protein